MIAWLGAGFLVAGFMTLMAVFRLADRHRDVMAVASRSLSVIGNPALTDDEKERALRRHAKHLFALLCLVTLGGLGAVLLPVGALWVLDRLGWLSLDSILQTALSPLFVVVSCAAILAALRFVRTKPAEAPSSYSPGDQLVHRLAFSTRGVQKAVAGLEDRLLVRRLAACDTRRPVFITALPRAGTTLLLECCARIPELASHCYRDMPFVLSPVAWSGFSRPFRRRGEARERAHGDGMLIDFDSPEALEEVIWMAFWRPHYASDRIIPWTDQAPDAGFERFLRTHMAKIVLLRRGPGAPGARYVSKNNLNIARLRMLHTLFPDAVIVVPFRDPLQHARSLLRQHRNFLAIHAEDPFAAEYMREIGHYDFGENLRPVDFDGWFDGREAREPGGLAFWLEYWLAAYTHIRGQHADIVRFVDYDGLCEQPEEQLRVLGETIGLREPGALFAAAPAIAPQARRTGQATDVPPALLARVDALHAELRRGAHREGVRARQA